MLLVAVAGCGEAAEAPPTPARPPSARVISCSPEVTRLLAEFGVAGSVVGADTRSLQEAGVSGALDLGPECAGSAAAARLAPALAIVLDAAPDAAERVRAPGIDALALAPLRLNEVAAAHFRVEAALGLAGAARQSTARLTREISAIATRRDGRSRLRVVWIVGREPLRVVGSEGMLHEVLELAGAENAFHGPPGAELRATPAEIAASAPDLVLDSTSEGAPAALPDGITRRRIPPELATLPALDVIPRVRRLHFLLYPDEGGAGL